MFSLLKISALVLSVATGAAAQSVTCTDSQLSCSDSADASCCFLSPGGQLLQTQFWDTNPVEGPTDSWTIHGLWPDNCDGTYSSNCDSSRDYTNITSILENAGKTDLLNYMNTYWVSNDESAEAFWEHEWATHGTCINTLDPSCYTNYNEGDEIPDFFQTVVDLFKTLDTYSTLEAAGITPSSSKTYTISAIQAAFAKSFGYDVYVACKSGSISQVYYTFNMRGSVQAGTFVPTSPSGSTSNCPSTGIKYPPKN